MLYFPRWKIIAILAVVLTGVVFALPNVLPKPWQDTLHDYTGLRPMTRGLDIQGGTSLLVELDSKDLLATLVERQTGDVRAALRKARIGYRLERTTDGVTVYIAEAADADKANKILQTLTQPIDAGLFSSDVANRLFDLSHAGDQFTFAFSKPGVEMRISQAIEKAVKILGDRFNGFGITEVTIQRHGRERILIQVPGSSNPEAIVNFKFSWKDGETLRGAGQISANLTMEEAASPALLLRSGALPARFVYRAAQGESAEEAQAKGSES